MVWQDCRIPCGQHGSSTRSQCLFLLRWSFDALNQASSVFASYHNFWFYSYHIEGRVNTLADALSCNNLQCFFSQGPPAPCAMAAVPQSLMTIIAQNINWTSTSCLPLLYLSSECFNPQDVQSSGSQVLPVL